MQHHGASHWRACNNLRNPATLPGEGVGRQANASAVAAHTERGKIHIDAFRPQIGDLGQLAFLHQRPEITASVFVILIEELTDFLQLGFPVEQAAGLPIIDEIIQLPSQLLEAASHNGQPGFHGFSTHLSGVGHIS